MEKNKSSQTILWCLLIVNCFAFANLSALKASAQTLTRAQQREQKKAAERADKERRRAEKAERERLEEERERQEEAREKEAKRIRQEAERAEKARRDAEKKCRRGDMAYCPRPTPPTAPVRPTTPPNYNIPDTYPTYPSSSYYQQSDSQMLRNEISSSYAITEQDRASLNSFYSLRNYEPIFSRSNSLTYAAQDLKRAVQNIGEHGLHAADYWDQAAESLFSGYQINGPSAEVKLAQIFLRIAKDVSVGRIDPRTVSADIRYVPRAFTRFADLNSGLSYSGAMDAWSRVAPQHDRYLQLQVALRRLLEIEAQGGFKGINPSGSVLTIGVSGPTVLALKTRAQALGYVVDNLDSTYDEQLESIVKDVQEANMAPVTGILNPTDYDAWEAFSVTSTRRIQQIELNMEKLRWLPENLGARYLFVNLAKQSLEVIDPNLTNPMLRRQRIVGGRFERKTPSMQDKLVRVILNPNWTVPLTVFSQDKLPMIQQLLADPANGPAAVMDWFTKGRYVVWNNSMTKQLDPLSVDWMNLKPRGEEIWIQQLPGYLNALGVTKFLLANQQAPNETIYLHDTNDRSLLNESYRLRSSGCMRVQYPLELAEYVLKNTKWDAAKINAFVSHEGEVKEKETEVDMPQADYLPVYIMSLTAEVGEDNVMRFTRDEYKQNLDLLTKLQAAGYMK